MVHAHPDDEALFTGGILARYASEGAHVCLVTCTNGELGEIADVPELGTIEEIRPRLAEVRLAELAEACGALGLSDVRPLGYHDSGMAGTDGNLDPVAFINQDLTDVADRLVQVYREVRPQVVVTYNEFGFYGHPDHIRAHEAALRAIELSRDGSYRPDLGPAHAVSKLYFTAIPKSALRAFVAAATEWGAEHADASMTEEEAERIGTDDQLVTTAVDVSSFVSHKLRALRAHRTQLGTMAPFLAIPEEWLSVALATEHFVLVGQSNPGATESDLFEGLPEA